MNAAEIELRRSIGDLVTEAETLINTASSAARNLTEDEQKRFDAIDKDVTEKKKRLDDVKKVEQFRAEFASPEAPASQDRNTEADRAGGWAGEFLRSDEFGAFSSRGMRGQASFSLDGMSLRSLVDNTTSTSGAAFTQPALQSQVPLAVPDRQLRLIDLLPHGTTTDNSIIYIQDTTTSVAGDTAAETAEGVLKPESTETFVRVTDPVQTIPAFMNITRQAADDHQQLMSYLQGRLTYRVWRRLDNQVINGDGTGANLLGLLNRSGILTYAPGTAEARVFSIRKGETLAQQNEQEPSIVVLNPSDMEKFDLTVASGSGEFLTQSGARMTPPPTAWGMRAVWSNAIAAGTAMLIDPTVAMLWDRRQPTVYLTDSHASNFTSNILTLLVEARAAISLFQPKGVVKITFNGTT